MHEQLWAGVGLKLEHSFFHFLRMGESLQPPENSPTNVTLEAAGAIIGARWQVPFHAYLDAFLLMARSVPEIINCCFGYDSTKAMKDWFDGVPADEQTRRKQFSLEFEQIYKNFRDMPLSTARNISAHRVGYPDVTVAVIGAWGVRYEGSPIEHVPSTETREIDIPELGFLSKPHVLRPDQATFQIDGRDLFDACREYLAAARRLMADAQEIAARVHNDKFLTSPPSK